MTSSFPLSSSESPSEAAFRAALDEQYLIERELGHGGMATVYLATDRKHRRQVAVKALHRDFAAVLGTARFQREIETTAGMRHPNILPLFDSGEAAGTLFYVMPFIAGDSLRARLDRVGRLSVGESLRLAREIGDALAYAHERGIVHRDIKPENVLLDDGHAVVADFGIARAVSEAVSPRLTQGGSTMGTPLYMSPEQGQGESDVDARSDQYSLSCVLYEMLVGHPPFDGATGMSILVKHIKDPAPTLDRDDIPVSVRETVRRGMGKERGNRFPTMRDWLVALDDANGGVTMSATAAQRASDPRPIERATDLTVGIEPFIAGTNDPELASIVDGLTDDIAAGLSLFPYLTVVRSPAAASRYVVQGRVRRSGTMMRATVQLVERETGSQLWGEIYDRDLTAANVFSVVDGITDRVIATVADPYGVLVRTLTQIAARKTLSQLTPYEAVLLYYYFHQQPVADAHQLAREALERATLVDPNHADVWACLAFIYLDEDRHGFNPRPDSLERALGAARKAIQIDPTSANAHRALAEVHFFRGDRDGFQPAADRAIALNPRDGTTVAMLGNLMSVAGQEQRGVALIEGAMALNPHHPGWYRFGIFFSQFRRGDIGAALDTAQRINMPGYFLAVMILCGAQAAAGNASAAIAARDELLAIFPTFHRDGVALISKWLRWSPEVMLQFATALVRAGVFPPEMLASAPQAVAHVPSVQVTAPRPSLS